MINKFVPVIRQKRTRKKHLSKDALNKIRNKRRLWKVYKCTGNHEDYIIYKEALEEMTQEIRKYELYFEHKLAANIKKDSKSFFAYIKSKQKVKDRVGPLKDIDWNVITRIVDIAESLNNYFSSVFTLEETGKQIDHTANDRGK